MNTLQTIYNKLADKTELASQKVELGLIDDLNKALAEGQEILGGLKKDNQRIDQMKDLVDKKLKERAKLEENEKKSSDIYFNLKDKLQNANAQKERDEKALKMNEESIDGFELEKEKAQKSKEPKSKKAQSLIVIFDKNIQKAETSAKELGIKLPIAQYQKTQEELKRNL
jgi:predicted nuclease with TOPRIM domain